MNPILKALRKFCTTKNLLHLSLKLFIIPSIRLISSLLLLLANPHSSRGANTYTCVFALALLYGYFPVELFPSVCILHN